MTNPLFAVYCDAIRRPDLVHETMSHKDRADWFRWIATARAAFRTAHPEYVEADGGVKAEHHASFVDFCAAKYPKVRG